MNELWSNRGMLLEHLLNRTIDYYEAKGIGLFEKRSVPISFRRVGPNNRVTGKIIGTAKVDYLGFANGRHYEFEAKQAKGNSLPLAAFTPHQLERLNLVAKQGGTAFVIIAFDQCDEVYVVTHEQLTSCIASGQKSVKRDYMRKECQALHIQTPGIIDFLSLLS